MLSGHWLKEWQHLKFSLLRVMFCVDLVWRMHLQMSCVQMSRQVHLFNSIKNLCSHQRMFDSLYASKFYLSSLRHTRYANVINLSDPNKKQRRLSRSSFVCFSFAILREIASTSLKKESLFFQTYHFKLFLLFSSSPPLGKSIYILVGCQALDGTHH